MIDDNVLVGKDLIEWCIEEIFNNSCYERGFGEFDKKYGFLLSAKDWDEIKKLIEDDEFPDGYYKLCDLIGKIYV